MYNTKTREQGEWVTIEGMEFLEVNGGGYIKKSEVGEEWVEFDAQTVDMLEDLIHKVKSGDEDAHFLLMNYGGDDEPAQMLGFRMSDMLMVSTIDTLVQQFTDGDPVKTMVLMAVLMNTLEGGDDE